MPNLGLLFPKGTWSIIHCVITLNESVKICHYNFKVNYPGIHNCDRSIVLEIRVSEEKYISNKALFIRRTLVSRSPRSGILNGFTRP